MKQKRRSPRVQWLVPCSYVIPKLKNGQDQHGWGIIRNISVSGAELATRFTIKKQTPIFLNFQLAKGNLFKKFNAQVLHVRQEGIYNIAGIKFELHANSEDFEKALFGLLNVQLKPPGETPPSK